MFKPSSKTQEERAAGSENVQVELDKMSAVLDRSVCVGSNLVDWWFENPGTEKMPTRTLVLITLHSTILSNADAISILLRNRSAEASKPLLRSMLESQLYLEWVLRDESGDMARAYLVLARKKELQLINSNDPESSDYKSTAGKLKPDDNFFSLDALGPHLTKQMKAKLEEQLAAPEAEKILENLASHKDKSAKKAWYALDGGPTSVESLARELGYGGFYERLYRPLSSNTHGSDSDTFVFPTDCGYRLKPLRRVENSPWIFGTACAILNRSNMLMSKSTAYEPLIAYTKYEYFAHIRPYKRQLEQIEFQYTVSPDIS